MIKKLKINNYTDHRGELIVIEKNHNCIPFIPKRTFFLLNIPENAKRAGHAIDNELFILPIKGSVSVLHTDQNKKTIIWELSNNKRGLYIPPYKYIELINFTADAIIAVAASKEFKDTNYFSLEGTIK